ncbi:anti-sigma factor domain-containing protein [Lentisalinibacter salinarum]|uniref:anti-sigma factor domain-containing protein n=1 Tax=Lentisalinibacter salinarum TaxID=2992239 RepID=UPI003862E74B
MNARNEEMLDLLVARATEGLSPEEERELERLLAADGETDPEAIELAAAAATNAFAAGAGYGEEMPAGLKDRLLADARARADGDAPRASATVTDIGSRTRRGEESRKSGGSGNSGLAGSTFNRLGWAAAAMLLVALLVVNRPLPEEPGGADPVEARAELMREEPGTMVLPWSPPDIDEYAGVSGDVVWNNEKQEGYLRLAGMPANNPARSQYQLWIVDPERDEQPVDGGVFDIPAGTGEVIVPIRAKLGVIDPQAFAITREQPGGVVVSDGPLLVVASAG